MSGVNARMDWLTPEQNAKIKTELETFKEALISE